MPKYVALVGLELEPFEADSEDDAKQYAYEEYMNLIQRVWVEVREVHKPKS